MKIEKVDHICFAVKDLEATKKVYKDDLNLEPAFEYVAASEKIKVARYLIGEVAVELMESTAPDGEDGYRHPTLKHFTNIGLSSSSPVPSNLYRPLAPSQTSMYRIA